MKFVKHRAITLFFILPFFQGSYGHNIPPKNHFPSHILWEPCPGDGHFECSSFSVPLDYAHPKVGKASLAIARLKASKHPRLGTIFTNPGGPGGSGVGFLLQGGGELISNITHGQYDIVSWDPRGVNNSSPRISCGFTSLESFDQFIGHSILSDGIEARGNFTDQVDLDAFFSKVNETDAKVVQLGKRCVEADGAFLKYMGTAAVVRDMVALSDAIDGPGKQINYWGFSYGTVIGNYFVNMFPERVGRVILDGVVDTIVQMGHRTEFQAELSATESVLVGFAEQCAQAGPQNCAIAQNFSTPTSILQGIQGLIDTAYDLNKAGESNITSFLVRASIATQMYTPTTWDAQLVPQFESLVVEFGTGASGNAPIGSAIRHSRFRVPNPSNSSNNAINTFFGGNLQEYLSEGVITCVDSIDQTDVTTERVFQEIVNVTQKLTPTFGEVIAIASETYCHRFPVRAVERFTGPFNHTLANTILVIGNTVDPITPLATAQRIAAMLGKSARLLQQNGLGHTSLAENSNCTHGVIRDYFLHGSLPREGLVCDTDQVLFPPIP